jgi:transcriptional regulator with XRE-family HTH domain
MRLDAEKIHRLSRERGLSVSALLRRSGVSRTAYYSLARRPSVLPGSLHSLADALGVTTSDLLAPDRPDTDAQAQRHIREAGTICKRSPGASFENVWHTLCLLEISPLERLNRSLLRGRTASVHR